MGGTLRWRIFDHVNSRIFPWVGAYSVLRSAVACNVCGWVSGYDKHDESGSRLWNITNQNPVVCVVV